MIIQTENLQKRYGSTAALRGIDLQVAAGGIVGLLGPNGAGKTTLVEIVEGLRSASSGRVSVLGMDPQRAGSSLKERLGVQLQSTSLPQELTPRETLQLYGAFFGKSLPVETVLSQVGLEEKIRSRNRQLSGGQKQRLAIGMALINDPELVILDEPTTGLDPVARRAVHGIISRLRQQGRTVILTTHYIEEAEKLSDRVIMIRSGEVVADGTPFELIGRSAGASTIWIALDGTFDPAPLLATGAQPQGEEGGYLRYLVSDPAAAVIALGEILKAQQVTLTDLRMKRPTLEDVYLEMIGKPEED